jgi:hypothetical protein
MISRGPYSTIIICSLTLLAFGSADASGGAYADRLVAEARERRLAEHPEWRKLGHYRRSLLGRLQSQVDSPGFFLAVRGKTDPAAELEATLRAFFAPPPADPEALHPQCLYPARYAWLKEKLAFDPALLPERDCERLRRWRENLRAGGVTAVFASSYMNNPASMYGHTFLRLDRKDREGPPLTDYTVNFAADTPARNGLVFALKGLLGGYPGRFTTVPYYMKIQQYNNMEARDLWEYELDFSQAAVDRLSLHLWELGRHHFDYYFLTENCSYQLLPLMEAGEPSLRLSERFVFKAIPTDTVRAMTETPGLVRGRTLRPSAIRLVLARRAALSPDELSLAEKLAKGRAAPDFSGLEAFPPARQAAVLDSAHDYFRYRHGAKRFNVLEVDEYERALLLRRRDLGLIPAAAEPDPGEAWPPETGHRTNRFMPGVGRG